MYGSLLGDGPERFGGDVLELEGDDVNIAGKATSGVDIVVRSDHFDIGDLAGRGVEGGIESVNAVAHAPRGDGEHASELAAADNADGLPRENDGWFHEVRFTNSNPRSA